MIVAMVAVVVITGSLLYYFVFFRTGIEKAEIRLQEEKLELTTTVETIANTQLSEVDNYNKEFQDFIDFMGNYLKSKDKFETKWGGDSLGRLQSNLSPQEILDLTGNEIVTIKGIFVVPEFIKHYVEYDLEYIKARGLFWANMSWVVESGHKTEDAPKYYPDSNYFKDLDNVINYYSKREDELRNIMINFNNRAKELELPIPFPNK